VWATFLTFSGQTFRARGADVPQSNSPSSPEQEKVREKWRKFMEEAKRDFLSNNDRESAESVGRILQAIEQPGGLYPAAQTNYAQRMKSQVQRLVRRGALESAAALNWAEWSVLYDHSPGVDGPPHPDRPGGPAGPDGLVLYLPFDSPPTNSVVRDESGAGNHGRVEGAQWIPQGRFGGAYQFRITNLTDRIVIPDNNSLDVEQVTVAAWIKSADTDGFWNRILDKDWRKAYCLSLGGDWNGKGTRGKLAYEAKGIGINSDRAIGDGRWHHVAGTYDGEMKRLYVDGEPKQAKAERPGPLIKNNWDICIGNSVVDYGTGEFLAFDGLIDEVRVYNRALSAEEIKRLSAAWRAAADSANPAPSVPATQPAAADRLKQVKELYEKGLITKEDYDRKVKEILDSL
jgi:hypothetical protein